MPQFLFEGTPIEIEDGDTVLDAVLRAGVAVEHGCKAGACQSCLLKTNSVASAKSQASLDPSTVALGGFLACQEAALPAHDVSKFDASSFPTYSATVSSKRMLADDVCQLILDSAGFEFCPGRFIQLTHPSGVKRPYSVATSALGDKSAVELHIRILPQGAMSQLVVDARVGDSFLFQGPFGKCAYEPSMTNRNLLLMGSGTGLAPLVAIASDALSRGHEGQIWLYHGSAKPEGLYLHKDLLTLESQFERFRYIPCVDSGEGVGLNLGSPLEVSRQQLGKLDGFAIFLCGHPGLVKAAQKQCFLAGASMKDIRSDPFEAFC